MFDIQTYMQTASIVITMLSIALGIGVGIIQFRNLVKTRQIQLYMDLYNRITEKELHRDYIEVLLLWKWEDPNDFFEKYGPEKNLDDFMKFTLVTTYLENMGLFSKENLVDIRFVANLIGSVIQSFWEKYEPIIIEMRHRYNTPKIMPMTEYLYEQVKSVRPRGSWCSMSLEENEAIIRSLYEASNKHDVALLDEIIAPDFVDHTRQLRGLDNSKKFEMMFIKGFPDYYETIEDIIAEGDKVWIHFKVTATHTGEYRGLAPTGKKIILTYLGIYRIADGKVVERWSVYDLLDAYKQLGVIEFTEQGEKLFPEDVK